MINQALSTAGGGHQQQSVGIEKRLYGLSLTRAKRLETQRMEALLKIFFQYRPSRFYSDINLQMPTFQNANTPTLTIQSPVVRDSRNFFQIGFDK